MPSVVRNLIEYAGLADQFPALCSVSSLKQFNLQKTLVIPAEKPDVAQIAKVMAEVVIIGTRMIKTVRAISVEGQILTGFKLIVEGEIREKIEYIADEPSQPLHAANFNIPFSSFIILPCDFTIGSPVTVIGYIEDIYNQLMDKRCVFNNISALLVAE